MILYSLIAFFCVTSDAWGMQEQLYASGQGSSRMHLGQDKKKSINSQLMASDLHGDAVVNTSLFERDDENSGEDDSFHHEKNENAQPKPQSVFYWLCSCIKSMCVGYTWVTNVLFNNHLRKAERANNFRHAEFRKFVKDGHDKLDISIRDLEAELVKINVRTIEKIIKVQNELEKKIGFVGDAAAQLDPEIIFSETRNKAEDHMRELQSSLEKMETKISETDITAKTFFSVQAKELLRQTEEHWAGVILVNVAEVNKKLSELERTVSAKGDKIDKKADEIETTVLESKEQVEQLKSASQANTSTILSKIELINGQITASAAANQKARNIIDIIIEEKKTLEDINEQLRKDKQELMKILEVETKKNSELAQEARKQHAELSGAHSELLEIFIKLMQEVAATRQALKNEEKERKQEAKKNKELIFFSGRVENFLKNRSSCSNKIISDGSITPYRADEGKNLSYQLFDLKKIT